MSTGINFELTALLKTSFHAINLFLKSYTVQFTTAEFGYSPTYAQVFVTFGQRWKWNLFAMSASEDLDLFLHYTNVIIYRYLAAS